jgi:hypothetical protein
VAITDDGHSHEDLLEQLRQMMSLNSMLSEQLTVCEGQLSLYKDRLMEVNRRNPVAAAPWTRRDSISSTHSVDGFDGFDGINGIDRLSAPGGTGRIQRGHDAVVDHLAAQDPGQGLLRRDCPGQV